MMHDDDFHDELRGYLRRRDSRVRPLQVRWPRRARRSIAQVVAVAAVVAIFVAGAIVGGIALRGSRSNLPPTSTAPATVVGTPGTPAERADAAIAYDPETGQVVMFGGLGDNGSFGDTWIWNGTEWLWLHLSVSPLSRLSASMVYDAKLHGLVLVGGQADQPTSSSEQQNLSATWLWTGTSWRRLVTRHNPSPNTITGTGVQGPIAYDAATGRVVLVATEQQIHFQACSTTTWTFDGNDWSLAHPTTPLPAPVATLVDEPQTGHLVAVLPARAAVRPGGFLTTSCPARSPEARALPQSSTWRWTGSNWVEVSTGTDPEGGSLGPVSGAAMVVTENNEALWSWNGERWTELPGSASGPSPRTDSMQSIDSLGHVVLFGGIHQSNGPYAFDTWQWNGSRWQKQEGLAPQTATPSPESFTAPPG